MNNVYVINKNKVEMSCDICVCEREKFIQLIHLVLIVCIDLKSDCMCNMRIFQWVNNNFGQKNNYGNISFAKKQ